MKYFILKAFAVTTDEQNLKTSIPNPFKVGSSLPELFAVIVDKVLLPIGGVLAVVAFIWSGFMFVTAQGKPDKIESAKKALLYTAIGTAILLGADVIAKVIVTTIGAIHT